MPGNKELEPASRRLLLLLVGLLLLIGAVITLYVVWKENNAIPATESDPTSDTILQGHQTAYKTLMPEVAVRESGNAASRLSMQYGHEPDNTFYKQQNKEPAIERLFVNDLDKRQLDQLLEERIIVAQGLSGNPVSGRTFPSIETSKLAQLGRELFFSKSLSGDMDVACASCHHPLLGGSDALSLPVGVGAMDPDRVGAGRRHDGNPFVDPEADAGPNVERNSSTTFNVGLYKNSLFFDGRAEVIQWIDGRYHTAVEAVASETDRLIKTPDSRFGGPDPRAGSDLVGAQSRFPVVALNEMRGFSDNYVGSSHDVRHQLEQRLQGKTKELVNNRWPELFRWALEQPDASVESLITYSNIAVALAAYQQSQLFIESPWKAWLEGRGGLTPEAKKGAALFYTPLNEGGAQCYQCHRGDFFTDERFYNLSVPQFGRGKTVRGKDFGRYGVTRNPLDMYSFRVPSLLNITETAPYGHTGAFMTLEGIIEHHMMPQRSLAGFDYTLQQLPQFRKLPVVYETAKENTDHVFSVYQQMNHENGIAQRWTNDAVRKEATGYLVAFLESLTDPCITNADCMKPWMPQGPAPDQNRLEPTIGAEFDNERALPEWVKPEKSGPVPKASLGAVPAFTLDCAIQQSGDHGFGFDEVSLAIGLDTHRQLSTQAQHGSGESRQDIAFEMLMFTGGMAVGDINGDCFTDLIVDQGDQSAGKTFLNQGDGTFKAVNKAWGLPAGYDLTGAVLADLNGDGWLDLFTGNLQADHPKVLLSNGKDQWLPIGHAGFRVSRATLGANFGDVDGDGDLDAWLAHWDGLNLFGAEEEHLWLNDGNGVFTGRAREFGVAGHIKERDFTFTPNFADLNNDHWPDMALTADFMTSQYFINQQGQSFENTTDKRVIQDDNGMGASIADFDNDGDLDWFVTSVYVPGGVLTSEMEGLQIGVKGNRLYRNDTVAKKNVRFSDITDQAGVADGGWGWGSCAADFNNDGWLDIFHVNGFHVDLRETRKDLLYLLDMLGLEDFELKKPYSSFEDFQQSVSMTFTGQQLADLEAFYYLATFRQLTLKKLKAFRKQSSRLFINQKDGTFKEMAAAYGVNDTGQGRGVSCFDYDRDGDIDIITTNNTGKVGFYRNTIHGKHSQSTNFLTVKLLGKAPNQHAIGARIYLQSASGTQMREVRIENNFMSQNPVESHFGLGGDKQVMALRIVWPDGEEERITNLSVNQMLVVRQKAQASQ
ncbi:FG-GAP-like repeat-containing protein [Kistimonas asteriae]|uniref:FG-GAP-like repeat-containing protein n=1 Tax=Kistimonas asteriae TaxID=517724 RepID=UPI001BA46B19|nr:FG-GAP-like repeat-containing protein [Kistimonas asteriae]